MKKMTLFQKIHLFLKQPFPLDLSFKQTLKQVLGFSLFVFSFLYLFQPFGIQEETDSPLILVCLGYGGITFFVALSNRLILTRIFSAFYQENKWTIYREVGDSLWHILTIGLANTLYAGSTSHQLANIGFWDVLYMIAITLLVSIPPTIIFVSFEYNRHLKRHLKQAGLMNQQIHEMDHTQTPSQQVTLTSEIGKDEITLDLQTLLYIQSIENYVNIFWKEDDHIHECLLRSSLTRIEKALQSYPIIFRCHRTFLVNLEQITNIEGNSQGYQLTLSLVNTSIPVSRSNSKILKQRLGFKKSGRSTVSRISHNK